MPSNGLPCTVAHTQVQVRTVHAYCAYEAHDLEMTSTFIAFGLIGKTQVGLGQAAHTGHDPTGFDVFLPDIILDFLLQILSGLQPERMNFERFLLHGVFLFAMKAKECQTKN